MDLQRFRDWLDAILKLVSIVAIVIGGTWAYYQFLVTRTTASNVQLTVSAESQRFTDDSRLLLIHVKPKNIGKVIVTPSKAGFILTVSTLPVNAKTGLLEIDKLPLFYQVDLLKRYPDGYELEPGVEYDELVTFVVPCGSIYSAKAVLNLGDATEVDHTTIAHAAECLNPSHVLKNPDSQPR